MTRSSALSRENVLATLKDPVTGLLTESYFRERLESEFSLFDLTSGKLRGGMQNNVGLELRAAG